MLHKGDFPQRPARFLRLATVLVTLMLTGQLAYLQIGQAAFYQATSDQQQARSLPLYAQRGMIYDRHGRVLVANRAAYSVSLVYPSFDDQAVLARLAKELAVPLADIQRRIDARKREWRFYEPVLVKTDITPEQHTRLKEMQADLPGVLIEPQPVREYPAGSLAAHVLGYVGEISEQQLASLAAAGYGQGDLIGQYGLESYYEDRLRGQDGVRWVQVDHMYRPLGEMADRRRNPEPGQSLVLTLDSRLQQLAEAALDYTMWRIQHLPERGGPFAKARAGAVVAIHVPTGEVLAMASRPAFDPNVFVGGVAAADYQALIGDPWAPFLNRAVSGLYAPGSTFKMVTAAAGLAEGVTNESEEILCSGIYDKVHPPKRDWLAWGHGWTGVGKALAESCDIYFYELGWRLGIDRLVDWTERFGLGVKTGIDLPGEEEGIVPGRAYRQRRSAQGNPWQRGDDLSAAIGQASMTFTPLQLAHYTAILASRGVRRQPHLLRAVIGAGGDVIETVAPVEAARVQLTDAQWDAVIEGMVQAHAHPRGTGYGVFHDFPVPTAGKTGTAEVFGYDDYGVYVAFAPVENPEIAVAVLVEQAGHGSSLAPVVKAIFADYFGVQLPAGDLARVPPEWPDQLDELKRKLGIPR